MGNAKRKVAKADWPRASLVVIRAFIFQPLIHVLVGPQPPSGYWAGCAQAAKGCSGFPFLPCPEQLLSSSFRCKSCLVFFWAFFIASGKVQRCHVRWAAAVLCCRGRRGMCTRLLARNILAMYFFRDHLGCLRPDFTDNAILFGTQFWFWEFMDCVLGLTAAGFPLAWEPLKIILFSCNQRIFFSRSTH